MASPFSLFGMARRATANFRQMSYGTVSAPSTPPPPAAAAAQSDNSDAASIASATSKRRPSSPLIQTTGKPSTAVVDNVDVIAAVTTSSPASSPPPAAQAVLQEVSQFSSAPVLAEEPESMLSESPKMDPVDSELDEGQVPPGGMADYFSLPPSTRPRGASDASDLTKVDPAPSANEEGSVEMKKLEARIQVMLYEKQRLVGDLERLSAANRRLENELKEKHWVWEADRSALVTERDREREQFNFEKNSWTDQLRELSGEKDRLAHDVGQKQVELDWERVRSEEMVKRISGLEKENRELRQRVDALKSTVVEQEAIHERLDGVVAALQAGNEMQLETISSLQQELSSTKEEMKNAQAQVDEELEAAVTETRLLSQQLEDEKAARDAERAKLLREKADQQQHFEEARTLLGDRVAALVQDVATKDQACAKLEEDLAIVQKEKEDAGASLQREMESAKEEAKKQIDSLNDQLGRLKKESDRRAERVAELEKEKAEQCTIM